MLQTARQDVFPEAADRRDRFSPENRRRLSAPGLRVFLALADRWTLSEAERLAILGYPSRSTYHAWCQKVRRGQEITLDLDQLTRISAVLGIHQALMILFGSEEQGRAWLRTSHVSPAFGGQRPLDLVTSGSQDGILYVRRFLDGARGGLYMPPLSAGLDATSYDDGALVFK